MYFLSLSLSLSFFGCSLPLSDSLLSFSLKSSFCLFISLSSSVYLSTDYRKRNGEALLPVRWMAPESLQKGIFDSTTDVWSMGIVMWEIITLATMPYPGLNNQDVFEKVCNKYIYIYMCVCANEHLKWK